MYTCTDQSLLYTDKKKKSAFPPWKVIENDPVKYVFEGIFRKQPMFKCKTECAVFPSFYTILHSTCYPILEHLFTIFNISGNFKTCMNVTMEAITIGID